MVAARRTDVAFMAGVGSPGVSIADAEVHRRTKVLREAGVGAETVAAAGEAWRCIFAIAGAGATTEELTHQLDQALRELAVAPDLTAYQIPGYVRENPMLSAVPPMLDVAELIAMVSTEPAPQLLYDPATDYARIRCPVLLQYGPLDTSVPVDASVRSIEQAARQTDLPVTIRVYPGLEHMLNVVPDDVTGLAPEAVMYGFHRFRFGRGVWHDLTDWLRNVALSELDAATGAA
jgi:pimeloyl-ACP methyl ester carboxylesterase